ncbi:MAG: carboxymethylenebutenolidase [Sphingobacteriales bacterium SCN 48-20]|uniref:dienelactone hydrolase family protein n=1 Tax=Terrimonas ferruginea TaxID=249 RepID=UPI000869CB06|nr:dienelactone hydrolase family protein [Terrimonas ferruginea]MBN8781799.1 dienelactone hydrolase family protein [Terrimonas ferruginea]ODT90861.1 MAG: carboxymethylenebutenolidase [Sphingobacteriales bacterium SCN 48-20]OJW44946.1 MAG: carboxymethylenebutenolidase [Sphingobacteriales bacterium 48-107]
MDQRIIDLYDEYTHRPLTRPEFLRRLALLAGGMTAALALLPRIEVNAANASVTTEADLFTERVKYKGVNGEMEAYVARPKEEKPYPAVIIIHENRGLNAHIEDVARRAAQAGYLAVAPNALAVLGGTPANDDDARQLFQELKQQDSIENFVLAFPYLKTRKDYNGKAGCVGFCWGGAMANTLAVRQAEGLLAAVVFYGRQPASADVGKIKAAVQLHYAGLDTRINEGIDAYEKALKEHKINYEQYVYPGVNHAFHNDTAPTRYDAAAAKLAWSRTLAFFERYLA